MNCRYINTRFKILTFKGIIVYAASRTPYKRLLSDKSECNSLTMNIGLSKMFPFTQMLTEAAKDNNLKLKLHEMRKRHRALNLRQIKKEFKFSIND